MVYLLENRERLVTKEELLESIWKETAVTDDALVQCVMDIRRAIGDDSRRPPAIWMIDPLEDCLANAFQELGRWDEAIAEYERILRLKQNYPLAHYHLAQAYERKGKQQQALEAYERFLQTWKDADADLPQVITARQRSAR